VSLWDPWGAQRSRSDGRLGRRRRPAPLCRCHSRHLEIARYGAGRQTLPYRGIKANRPKVDRIRREENILVVGPHDDSGVRGLLTSPIHCCNEAAPVRAAMLRNRPIKKRSTSAPNTFAPLHQSLATSRRRMATNRFASSCAGSIVSEPSTVEDPEKVYESPVARQCARAGVIGSRVVIGRARPRSMCRSVLTISKVTISSWC
jgi:hypothetical protein